MSGKRKDHKGRILRTGESQRKDLLYQYRYSDQGGKRKSIYAPDLKTLRDKEEEIRDKLRSGIDPDAGKETVLSLFKRHVSLKQGVKESTRHVYDTVTTIIENYDFSGMAIRDTMKSHAKEFCIQLKNSGMAYSTVKIIRAVLKPAFDMAIEDRAILQNPFQFKLSDVIKKDTQKRIALTLEQTQKFIVFTKDHKLYKKNYDELVVLFGTGLRVSEFCGLTRSDIDFDTHVLHVNHQLERTAKGVYYIETPKTEDGNRSIPLTKEVERSLRHMVEQSRFVKLDHLIDGCTGFLSHNRIGNPKVRSNVESDFRVMIAAYNKEHPDEKLPPITPHCARHTFATLMANAGMDVKSLQYIMGHSCVEITLNVYAHTSFDHASESMRLIEAT